MDDFRIGDTVRVTGPVMTGDIGTVVFLFEERQQYLVRVGAAIQNFFSADELEAFRP